jgi:Sulfotransferase family
MRLIPTRVTRPIRERSLMAGRVTVAALSAKPDPSTFDNIRCYCMFIGYPRSGHSLVGSIVDAHPDAVIAHELDALRYVQSRFARRGVLYSMILRRDREFGDRGRTWTGYDYSVPGQAQGRFDELLVIGDKRGAASTKRLRDHPELLDRLRGLVAVDVRMVHVIRDPFDTISSMHRRGNEQLATSIDRFFTLCETNAAIRTRDPEAVLDVRLEGLVADPVGIVRRVSSFLGLDAPQGYLEACARVVFEAPKRTRSEVDWPEHLVDEVEHRMRGYSFLEGYAFDD